MSVGVSVPQSGDPIVDGLLFGSKWSGTSLTFSFPASVADLADYATPLDPTYFGVLEAAGQTAVRAALARWAAVAAVTFTEVAPSAAADLRIYHYDDGTLFTARVVAFPDATPEAGDLQFGSMFVGPDWSPGNYHYFTVVHEIGHALGLKHPHDTPNGFPAADSAVDAVAETIMSYRSYVGGPMGGYSLQAGSYPVGPMPSDIAAIQHLYGPNWATNAGDTTYTFDPSASVIFQAVWDGGGTDTYNFASYAADLHIDLRAGEWSDLGGQYAVLDTGDASIRPSGNVANPHLYQGDLRSLIENAVGGSGDDTLTGNQAANTLTGGAGDDSLVGGDGADTLVGGSGNDTLSGGAGSDRFTLGGGGDVIADFLAGDRIVAQGAVAGDLTFDLTGEILTIDPDGAGAAASFTVTVTGGLLSGYELVAEADGGLVWKALPPPPEPPPPGPTHTDQPGEGSDFVVLSQEGTTFAGAGADWVLGSIEGDWVHGNQGDDYLHGYGAADTVYGGQGDDRVFGDEGDDAIYGDMGSDRLDGGTGDDVAHGGPGDDVVEGGQGADLLYGGKDADTVSGGAGDDWIWGDLGDDRLSGGAGADRFAFVAGYAGNDVIADFSAADGDRIELRGVEDFAALTIGSSAAGATILLPTGEVITLLGVPGASLGASDFLFG
ncbi:hemolysin-type calcium-binding region protein [Phenylobacterium zucineum HLK1]|uniref:Hemolysin-type calcium-binding region protein n=1 Tax=Phenylobacterium zucineum (strain HLK1) TaxID=450851 RepID=B4RDD6_PHEZH|nr:M10 family metallopeptidase [Phenylobacterium zucineum]ACG78326.1 hemolysin-type calcium-binding region protein [Phenylobacterium zucineum HLK1]